MVAQYYTTADRSRIIGSFKGKPDFDVADFFQRLEAGADFYAKWAAGEAQHRRKPSDAKRSFEALHDQLTKLVGDLVGAKTQLGFERNRSRRVSRARAKTVLKLSAIKADRDRWALLYGAAEELADREGALPDLELEFEDLGDGGSPVPVWPIDRQLELALETEGGIAWLQRVVQAAAEAIDIRHAGNRADEALHWLVRHLQKLYLDAAAAPSGLTYDDAAGTAAGEFFDFLLGCVGPLGVTSNGEALRARLRRQREEAGETFRYLMQRRLDRR